ncbi:MAG: cytochrome-c peroxidase [Alphaproteobacteria bacterium]|nr:cytochrome-c peroxidase [Alphaproteobacteria bacterium]
MAGLVLHALLLACTKGEVADTGLNFSSQEWSRVLAASPRPEPPADPSNAWAEDPAAAQLGQFLYYDTRLSGNGEVACATCHDPAQGFGDGEQLAQGIDSTARHAPTIWSTVYNRWFFWDGRADSHWAQATGPIEAPNEQGFSRLELAHLLYDDAALQAAYTGLFGALPELSDSARFPAMGRPVPESPEDPAALAWDGMTAEDQDAVTQVFVNAVKAIAAYERRLIPGESDFDRYVADMQDSGASDALSPEAERGLQLFMGDAGCHFCHSGPNFSDQEFHNIGLGPRDWLNEDDDGRYSGVRSLLDNPFNAAGRWSDDPEGEKAQVLRSLQLDDEELLSRFKTPPLRDVALSAPYMHGGHYLDLEEVVHHYNQLDEVPVLGHREDLLLPLELEMAEIQAIVAFLESLTGDEPDPSLLEQPASPSL